MINTYFVGHLNDPSMLAGTGMGNIVINMLCISVFISMNGAIETLVSQAYGTGNLNMCSLYLNRGRVIVLLAFVPIGLALINTENILLAIGQDPKTSYYAQRYIVF